MKSPCCSEWNYGESLKYHPKYIVKGNFVATDQVNEYIMLKSYKQ